MTRGRVVLVVVLGLALALGLRAVLSDGAAPAPAARGGSGAPLRAETVVVAPSAIQETVQTVGTLAANESVDVVSELSRRLVAVRVEEGTVVEEGALLFQLDDADLRSELAKLEARRRLAARTEERQRELLAFEKKALSQQAYDEAIANLRTIEAELAALRVTLAKTEIRAPFRGRVGLRRVSEGAWLTPATVLTTLQDTSRIKIDFTLPERHASAVRIGQTFRFRVAGRGDDFEGTVIATQPAIDAPTRSLLVRGVSENPDDTLRPGSFVTLEVPLAQASEGILVPAEAVVPSATGHAVYVLTDGVAELREVEIGQRTRESLQILRGLTPGDTVLTTNLLRLRPGVRVEAVAPGSEAAAGREAARATAGGGAP